MVRITHLRRRRHRVSNIMASRLVPDTFGSTAIGATQAAATVGLRGIGRVRRTVELAGLKAAGIAMGAVTGIARATGGRRGALRRSPAKTLDLLL